MNLYLITIIFWMHNYLRKIFCALYENKKYIFGNYKIELFGNYFQNNLETIF